MKILTIITFYLIVVSSSAQALDGKWMMTKEGDTYIIPENLILEINSDSLKYFSFDQFQSSIPIKIENNKLIVNQTQTDIVEFINEDRIKIKSQEKDKNSLNETEYVRLKKLRQHYHQKKFKTYLLSLIGMMRSSKLYLIRN